VGGWVWPGSRPRCGLRPPLI